MKILEEMKETINELLKNNKKIVVRLESYSKSNLTRRIKFFIEDEDITLKASKVLGIKYNDKGLLIHGTGGDMLFISLYQLVKKVFKDENSTDKLKITEKIYERETKEN